MLPSWRVLSILGRFRLNASLQPRQGLATRKVSPPDAALQLLRYSVSSLQDEDAWKTAGRAQGCWGKGWGGLGWVGRAPGCQAQTGVVLVNTGSDKSLWFLPPPVGAGVLKQVRQVDYDDDILTSMWTTLSMSIYLSICVCEFKTEGINKEVKSL